MHTQKTITMAAGTSRPLIVNRLGYGTMRLTGEGIFGEPPNRPEALQILKRAVERGVNFVDTADYYGEDVTNRLIAEALYPYPADIATVENMYGHAQRTTIKQVYGETHGGAEVLEICEKNSIPLIPFFSLLHANDKKDSRIAEIANKYNVSEAQVNIAWLLHKSPWILPIPGTSSLKHLEENLNAADLRLSEADMKFLE